MYCSLSAVQGQSEIKNKTIFPLDRVFVAGMTKIQAVFNVSFCLFIVFVHRWFHEYLITCLPSSLNFRKILSNFLLLLQ